MKRTIGTWLATLSLLAVANAQLSGTTQESPDKEAFGPAQSAADYVREAASADIAFLPAGMMYRDFSGDEIGKLFKSPNETIHVVKLTGTQIEAALNRSVSLYPSPNSGFLQVSGLEVTFNPDKPASGRVVSVTVNGRPLEAKTSYDVAMPISLARGGYGYFNHWDKNAITRNLELTLESVLKGKKADAQTPRWKSVG